MSYTIKCYRVNGDSWFEVHVEADRDEFDPGIKLGEGASYAEAFEDASDKMRDIGAILTKARASYLKRFAKKGKTDGR